MFKWLNLLVKRQETKVKQIKDDWLVKVVKQMQVPALLIGKVIEESELNLLKKLVLIYNDRELEQQKLSLLLI
jgi:hypothetical protein